MARNARLPSPEIVRELHANGLSNREISERYGVTTEAVRINLKRAGVTVPATRTSHVHYIPWRLRSDHTHDVIARRLRDYSRIKQGGTISPDDQRKLDHWMEFMDGANPYGLELSVHYDRLDPDGFWLSPRQPGDRDYIHPPA
jgi:hypothetical protein